jgi:DNA-directed RNA polymerase specialized sigma24 family protein
MMSEYPTTKWTLIEKISHPEVDPEGAIDAKAYLAAEYWRPVYCFFRARGFSGDQADELAQEFFLRVVCRVEGAFRGLDRTRGNKFRSFLLGALGHFLIDRYRSGNTREGEFEREMVRFNCLLGEQDKSFDPRWNGKDPERIFHEQYDEKLVNEALLNFKTTFGSWAEYPVFLDFFFPEGDISHRGPTHQELGKKYGLTMDQVRGALHRVNDGLRASLRDSLRAEGFEEDDLAEEVCRLSGPFETALRSVQFRQTTPDPSRG